MYKNHKIKIIPDYVVCLLFIMCSLLSAACSKNNDKPKLPTDNNEDTTQTETGQQILLADPTIFYEDGTYYLYGTHTVARGFEVYLSTDLKNWKKATNLALDKGDAYGDNNFWAPQVFKYKNKYYMAYVANSHIAIASCLSSPFGPFRQEVKKPITSPDGYNMIDPYVFFDDDGKIYLYYVRIKGGNRIYVAELKDDLSDIIPGTVTSCINGEENPQKWENMDSNPTTVTEGPTVIKHNGIYYLFYSANGYKSIYYAVGYATASSPLGPWTKYSGNPILNKDLVGENGTGHGDFFQDKTGQYYYVFHTHYSDNTITPRKTALIKGKFVPASNGPDKMEFDKSSFYFLKYKQ